jgi:hypothetical protein
MRHIKTVLISVALIGLFTRCCTGTCSFGGQCTDGKLFEIGIRDVFFTRWLIFVKVIRRFFSSTVEYHTSKILREMEPSLTSLNIEKKDKECWS